MYYLCTKIEKSKVDYLLTLKINKKNGKFI
jgi:hypothetical protein